ncbi:MAG: hypothetical protein IT340_05700 [Chloroflexi bacterium]|nr:hypothetical protein [Chloroflexota bacterium]
MRRVIVALVAVLVAAVVLPPSPALAFGQLISIDGNNSDLWAAVAKHPTNGRLTAAWRSDIGSLNQVRVASSLDGTTWTSEIVIYSGNHSGYLETIRIAFDANGGLHVVFWAGQADNRRVYYRWVAAGADPTVAANWHDGGHLCGAGPCLEPGLAVDGAGYVYVVFEDTDNQLGVRRRQGTTGNWSAVRSVPVGQRVAGSLAVSPDGRVHIAYGLRSARRAFYSRYASFESWTLEAQHQLSTGDADAPAVPDVLADRFGIVHFAWQQDGLLCYRRYTGTAYWPYIECPGYTNGPQYPSLALSATGALYLVYNRANSREIWQNTRTSAGWGDPERLGADNGSGYTTRWQRYGVTWDGEVNLAFIQNGVARFHRVVAGRRDTQPPNVTAVTGFVAPAAGGQRTTARVQGTDVADVGEPAGVAAIQYSLDGVNYVTAAEVKPPTRTVDRTIDIDLANPGAGGNWGRASHPLYVRLVDALGQVGPVFTPAPTLAYALPAATTTRYLAEGYTGGDFDEFLTVANPGTATVSVAVTFQYANGSSGVPGTLLRVTPGQRVTLAIDEAAGVGKELSLKLESNAAFVAERPMYFTGYGGGAARAAYNRPGIAAVSGVDGGHLGVAATAPAAAWYFAEGYTGAGFDTYFTIQNPNATTAAVTITYYLIDGTTVERLVDVGARQRRTVAAHGPAAGGGIGLGQTFSARLSTATATPIIAERVMYFRYSSPSVGTVTGGTATLGAIAPARAWHFAEGYTGAGFDEFLTIQNPNPTAGLATIRYFVEGQPEPTVREVPLPASSRITVAVHEPFHSATAPGGLGRGRAHATTVETDVDSVVERPMYFLYQGLSLGGVDGGHNVLGATGLIAPGASVVMAEGYTGAGFEQYLTFQNPQSEPVAVTIAYLKADGSTVTRGLNLAPRQRTTVAVHRADDPTGAGLGPGQVFGTRVTVATGAPGGVLVERVMYFNYGGAATGGTSAFGV